MEDSVGRRSFIKKLTTVAVGLGLVKTSRPENAFADILAAPANYSARADKTDFSSREITGGYRFPPIVPNGFIGQFSIRYILKVSTIQTATASAICRESSQSSITSRALELMPFGSIPSSNPPSETAGMIFQIITEWLPGMGRMKTRRCYSRRRTSGD